MLACDREFCSSLARGGRCRARRLRLLGSVRLGRTESGRARERCGRQVGASRRPSRPVIGRRTESGRSRERCGRQVGASRRPSRPVIRRCTESGRSRERCGGGWWPPAGVSLQKRVGPAGAAADHPDMKTRSEFGFGPDARSPPSHADRGGLSFLAGLGSPACPAPESCQTSAVRTRRITAFPKSRSWWVAIG